MAIFADLSDYEYLAHEPGVLNVGWLDASVPYTRSSASPELLRALARAANEHHNVTRGQHHCTFCDVRSDRLGVYIDDAGVVRYWDRSILPPPAWLGMSEIRVNGADGVVYAAPTLVVHYVLDHDYQPPLEFVGAVLREFGDASVLPSD